MIIIPILLFVLIGLPLLALKFNAEGNKKAVRNVLLIMIVALIIGFSVCLTGI